MTLTAFQSDKGDCLLLQSADGTNVLCDGGMRESYAKHVAPALGALREAGHPLHLVYVSHIDQDHIAGVLKLLDDEVDWRVHDYQRGDGGNPSFPRPDALRPPVVEALWHNAFRDLVGANDGRIEDLLVTAMKASVIEAAPERAGSGETGAEPPRVTYAGLVSSIREALLLRHRVGPQQLGIPVNEPAGGRMMFIRPQNVPVVVGGFRVTVVGPLRSELVNLRKEWNKWLRENEAAVRRIRAGARRDAEGMGADEATALQTALRTLGRRLGDRDHVTTPNLASLMLLVEEGAGGPSVLLTGDGHADDVMAGLGAAGRLDGRGQLHVDVLKVPHHGSEHNARDGFFRILTADQYVFCGDGAHENPDPRIVQLLIDERTAASDRPFTLWFNSSEAVATREDRGAHMRKIERLVGRALSRHSGRMEARFLTKGSSLSFTV